MLTSPHVVPLLSVSFCVEVSKWLLPLLLPALSVKLARAEGLLHVQRKIPAKCGLTAVTMEAINGLDGHFLCVTETCVVFVFRFTCSKAALGDGRTLEESYMKTRCLQNVILMMYE